MRSISRILTTAGVIAAAIGIGIFFGWLAMPHPKVSQLPPTPINSGPAQKTKAGNPDLVFSESKKPKGPASGGALAGNTAADQGVITNWDDRIDGILRDDSTDVAEKARRMMALFPRMPEAGQEETARHICNLIDDKDYPEFSRYLTNSTTPAGVLDVLMMDVINRPNSLKMPLLLDLARTPDHPKSADARGILQMYFEEDYGTNWTVMQEKVDQWLKDNPD